MKKIICVILSLMLLAALTVPAIAADTAESGNSQEVLASYEEGTLSKTVVSVDISWNQMSFTYKGASEPVWDATNHQYVGEYVPAAWAASEATITFTNHSNSILQAELAYTQEENFSGIQMLYTDAAPYIGSAYTSDTDAGEACTVVLKVIPEGELSADTQDNTRIGVITAKITSDIDAGTVYDAIESLYSVYASRSLDSLSRGGVGFTADTDLLVMQTLLDDTVAVIYDSDKTEIEKNQALNALITAFYGALDIKQ